MQGRDIRRPTESGGASEDRSRDGSGIAATADVKRARSPRLFLAMTTRKLSLVAAAALAAAAAVLLPAGGAQANRTTGTVLELKVTATKLSTVDVPPLITSKRSPESPGDEVIAGVSKISGAGTGRRFLVCAVTQTAPSIEQALYACQLTYKLTGGTITASGVVHLNDTAAAAITGGTGAYAGARGVLASARQGHPHPPVATTKTTRTDRARRGGSSLSALSSARLNLSGRPGMRDKFHAMETGGLVMRPWESRDLDAVAALLRASDDSRVVSPAGFLHSHATRPERAQILELVAELDGVVVADGVAGLNSWTTTEGAALAFVTVDGASRRQGIGEALGARLLEHLRELGATSATSFFRFTEEGERWALARGWQRLLSGPLIALDPRGVPEPSLPPGYRCVPMSSLQPEAVYEAVTAAALDEPTAVPNDNILLDDFVRDWDDPDLDLDASSAVLAPDGQVAAFAFIRIVATARSTASRARNATTAAAGLRRRRSDLPCGRLPRAA